MEIANMDPEKPESTKGKCGACKKAMTFEEFWTHQNSHKPEEYPESEGLPGSRSLFIVDPVDLATGKQI